MDKQILFCAGLPRSGSTLLLNILAQNPKIHTTATSPLCEMVQRVRNQWRSLSEVQAMRESERQDQLKGILAGMMGGAYQSIDASVVIDKNRGWVAQIETLKWALDQEVRIICPVRDFQSILASMELRWRDSKDYLVTPEQREMSALFDSQRGRLDVWTDQKGMVGRAYNALKDAFHRGCSDRLLMIEYDILCSRPQVVIDSIYDFCDLPRFSCHQYDVIEQKTCERDDVHGYKNLHTIRAALRASDTDWKAVLGADGEKYQGLEFWRHDGNP